MGFLSGSTDVPTSRIETRLTGLTVLLVGHSFLPGCAAAFGLPDDSDVAFPGGVGSQG